MPKIKLEHVVMRFGTVTAARDINEARSAQEAEAQVEGQEA